MPTNDELFPKLTSDEVAKLSEYGFMTTILPGTLLYWEGVPNHAIYAVMSGELQLVKHFEGQERLLASYVSGDFSGDIHLLIGLGAAGDLISTIRSVVFQLETSAIPRIASDHPELGNKLLRTFARRSLASTVPGTSYALAPTRQVPHPTPKQGDRLIHAVSPKDHSRGPADGVELVVYGDYQCPFTWKGEEILESLMDDETETPIRYTFRHFPQVSMHPQAELGAWAAESAHLQNRFWDYHQALLQLRGKFDRKVLVGLAGSLKLDVLRFEADLDSESVRKQVLEDLKFGEEDGVEITPALFLESTRYTGSLERSSLSNTLIRVSQKRKSAA
jgi:protein-disulfide isomerase